ncbi:MAG: hypothetical protein N4A50_09905 [Vallitalea sp.]|nr:hypothetical protein [Vallitalea sp.]
MKKFNLLSTYILMFTIALFFISFNKLVVYSQHHHTFESNPLENMKMTSLEKDSDNLNNDSIGNITMNRMQHIKARLSFSLLPDEVIYVNIPMFYSPIERDDVIYNIDNVTYFNTNIDNDFTIDKNCLVFNNSSTPLLKGYYTIDISIKLPDLFDNPKGFREGDKLISDLQNIIIYKPNIENPSTPYELNYSPNISEPNRLKINIATSNPVINSTNILKQQTKNKDIIKLNITDKQSKIVQWGWVRWRDEWSKQILSSNDQYKIDYIKLNKNLIKIINLDIDANNLDNIQQDFQSPYRFEIKSKYIPVTENGTYILYVKDACGIEKYDFIKINGILDEIPDLT